jgi:two-component sensor histidine kinase
LDKAFEALTNAIKHAFRNDGVGLSPVQPKAGLGASLLEEFARQAGGTLSLEGGKGTMARLALPLSAAMSSADNDQNLA